MNEAREHYPDLIEVGGLGRSLQQALRETGSPLQVCKDHEDDEDLTPSEKEIMRGWPVYVRAEQNGRASQVYIAAQHRMFVFDFWSRGVMLANASTPDLVAAARAIHRWIVDRVSTSRLHKEFPFVKPEVAAQAFEAGNEVEWRWTEYEKSIPERFPELTAFFDVARRTPELRQLFPFTSLNCMCFSRCTGYPYTEDCPAVVPKTGRGFRDIIPNRYRVVLRNRELGEGDAAEAVRIVVANLPANCGPAVAGTADDLAGEQ